MLSALAEKAALTEQIFNTTPGIKCNPVQGAMYTFPCISLPQKAINKAKVWALPPPPPTPSLHECGEFPQQEARLSNHSNQLSLNAGGRPHPRHVLLHEAAGGGRNLPGTRQWLWPEGGNVPLQVSTTVKQKNNNALYHLHLDKTKAFPDREMSDWSVLSNRGEIDFTNCRHIKSVCPFK